MEFRLYRNLSYSHFSKKCCYLISNSGIYLYKIIFVIQLTLFFIRYICQKEDIFTVGSKNMIWTVDIIFCPVNCHMCKSWTFTIPGKASNNSLLRESMFM